MQTKTHDNDGLVTHLELRDDVLAKNLPDGSIVGVSEKEYNRILRKVDYRVIPILAALYLLSFLDRGKTCHLRIRRGIAFCL